MAETFLSARWEHLIMANYAVPADVLKPYLPKGVELDLFDGRPYVSLVGFMFNKTSLFNIPIPFLGTFEEINLRFYVKRKTADCWKRGVVFIKEIVPKPAIAIVAKTIYREPYVTMPMKHEIIHSNNNLTVGYYLLF